MSQNTGEQSRPHDITILARNKMYYTQAGGVDLLKAKWKKLSEFVSVECDGEYIVIITCSTCRHLACPQVWTSRPSCANTRSTPFSSSTCRASARGRGPGTPPTARSGWTTVSELSLVHQKVASECS